MDNNIINTLSEFEKLTLQQANRDFVLNITIAIITFISVLLFYIDYKNRKNKERAEKSISIAEDFAKSVIPKFSIIHQEFDKFSDLSKIINKVKFINFIDFDNSELYELYSCEEIEKYKHILNNHSTIKIGEDSIDLRDFIVVTLNELEHICMYISTKVADDKYIYNSLHQQFFKSISSLYISIALINTDNKDKYYTNIIEVFNLWKAKYIKFEKREKRLKSKLKPRNPKI